MTDKLDINWVDEEGRTQLCIAARDGNLVTARDLLSMGADTDKTANNGFAPLHLASEFGHTRVVELLSSQGADLNKPAYRGYTPLLIAAQFGHVDVVEVLCSQGADLNKPQNEGATPLFIAAQKGHVDVVEVLCSQGADLNKPKNTGSTPLFIAAQQGHNHVVEVLCSQGADVNKPKNTGSTPLFIAVQEGHKHVVEVLCSQGADVNKPTNDGQTPITVAIEKQHDDIAQVLQARGASIPTDDLNLVTVNDVVQFFKLLNIQQEKLPQIENKIKEDMIDAKTLFLIPDGETMMTTLGVSEWGDGRESGWGYLFYRLVKNHEKIQLDRKQTDGAAERAAKALEKMDNKRVRKRLYELQRDFFHDYIQLVLPRLQTHGQDVSQKLTKVRVEEKFENTIKKIREEASKEESRLGSEVIEVCLEKYKALKERWSLLEHLPEISSDKSRNCQPIANTSFGVSEGEPSPFGSTKGNNPNLERLEHLVFLSRGFAKFFERQMELITRKVNNAKNPQALGLHHDEYMLPFKDNLTATGGKRAHLTMGPIKKAERALKKAKEYEEEMNRGDKDTEINGIQVLSPADFVIDFLRCTIEVEDPYLVAVVFAVLLKEEVATCLQICRAKNKFMDKSLPKHIQTNVLMNLALIYPHNQEEFENSGLVGDYDSTMAGRCMMVCELQITMKDFLHIKRLQHAYYDITRAEVADLPNLLLTEGVFIKPNLEEKIPKVVMEMNHEGENDDVEFLKKELEKKNKELEVCKKELEVCKKELEEYKKDTKT